MILCKNEILYRNIILCRNIIIYRNSKEESSGNLDNLKWNIESPCSGNPKRNMYSMLNDMSPCQVYTCALSG